MSRNALTCIATLIFGFVGSSLNMGFQRSHLKCIFLEQVKLVMWWKNYRDWDCLNIIYQHFHQWSQCVPLNRKQAYTNRYDFLLISAYRIMHAMINLPLRLDWFRLCDVDNEVIIGVAFPRLCLITGTDADFRRCTCPHGSLPCIWSLTEQMQNTVNRNYTLTCQKSRLMSKKIYITLFAAAFLV